MPGSGGFSSAVALTLTAPATTTYMMISRSSELTDAAWENYAPSRAFAIDGPDGTIAIYAKFRDAGGALSPAVSDDIEKDTYARVISADILPEQALYAPGETVRFRMRVEGDDGGGREGVGHGSSLVIRGTSEQVPSLSLRAQRGNPEDLLGQIQLDRPTRGLRSTTH